MNKQTKIIGGLTGAAVLAALVAGIAWAVWPTSPATVATPAAEGPLPRMKDPAYLKMLRERAAENDRIADRLERARQDLRAAKKAGADAVSIATLQKRVDEASEDLDNQRLDTQRIIGSRIRRELSETK